MKKNVLLILLTIPIFSSAQVLVAGTTPLGAQILTLEDSMSTPYVASARDSVSFDIDCDNIIDFELYLDNGDPWNDVPHHLRINHLDSTMFLCILDSPWVYNGSLTPWYDQGDTMNCPSGYTWQNLAFGVYQQIWIAESNVFIGIFNPPSLVNNKYYAFLKQLPNNQQLHGWVELSFNLDSLGYPTAVVHRFTQFCTPQSTKDIAQVKEFSVFPSIVHSNFSIRSASDIKEFKASVYNLHGQILVEKSFSTSGIHSFDIEKLSQGNYFLRLEWDDQVEVHRLLKQ